MNHEQKLYDHAFALRRLDGLRRFASAALPAHEHERMSFITEEVALVACRVERIAERTRRRHVPKIGRLS